MNKIKRIVSILLSIVMIVPFLVLPTNNVYAIEYTELGYTLHGSTSVRTNAVHRSSSSATTTAYTDVICLTDVIGITADISSTDYSCGNSQVTANLKVCDLDGNVLISSNQYTASGASSGVITIDLSTNENKAIIAEHPLCVVKVILYSQGGFQDSGTASSVSVKNGLLKFLMNPSATESSLTVPKNSISLQGDLSCQAPTPHRSFSSLTKYAYTEPMSLNGYTSLKANFTHEAGDCANGVTYGEVHVCDLSGNVLFSSAERSYFASNVKCKGTASVDLSSPERQAILEEHPLCIVKVKLYSYGGVQDSGYIGKIVIDDGAISLFGQPSPTFKDSDSIRSGNLTT